MTTVPRWLILQEQIDLALWELGRIKTQVTNRSALDYAIDQATGHEDTLTAEATELMTRLNALRAEWDTLADTP